MESEKQKKGSKIELTVTDEIKREVFDHFTKGICERKNCKKKADISRSQMSHLGTTDICHFLTFFFTLEHCFWKTTSVAFLQKVRLEHFTTFTTHYFAKPKTFQMLGKFNKCSHSRVGKNVFKKKKTRFFPLFLTILSILSQSSHVPVGKTLKKRVPYLSGTFIEEEKKLPFKLLSTCCWSHHRKKVKKRIIFDVFLRGC